MSRTKYIGLGLTVSIIGLITWFVLSQHFDVELPGNKFCLGDYNDICEGPFNITLKNISTWYIYNKNAVKLSFEPDVKEYYYCKKDGRYSSKKRLDREKYPCGVGWREFDWTTPLTSRYSYIEKFIKGKKNQYKIVIFKHNPTDTIKWGGKITGEEFDPVFFGYKIVYQNRSRRVPIYKESVVRTVERFCYANNTCVEAKNITRRFVDYFDIQYYNGKRIGIEVNNIIYENSNIVGGKLYKWSIPIGDRNYEEYGECRVHEVERGVCTEVGI